jgi:D-3-phosphoglycerate dehydrogenase
MKILVTVAMDAAGLNLLKNATGAEVVQVLKGTEEQLQDNIVGVEALIAGTRTPVGSEVLDRGKRLRVIGLLGVGRPMLDLEAATKKGVLVINAPGSVAVSVAEHALALIFALARKTVAADATSKKGSWERRHLKGRELRNKVLGIIGFGAVGSLVAERARGLAMKVIVHDPYISGGAVQRQGCTPVSLHELFQQSDLITVHTPLTPETRGLIGADSLAIMKRSVLLVNCSAAEIVDETALYEAITDERIAGCALDLHREGLITEHPLYLSDRVVCTPDLSAFTEEAVTGGSVEIAHSVIDYLEKGIIAHAVNLPGAEKELTEGETVWLDLGEVLGLFVSQLHPYGIREVAIERAGEENLPALLVFTQSIVAGLLRPILGERVNRVNARSLAEERGIHISETRSSTSPTYRKLVTVKVRTDQGDGEVSGTLFDDRIPRIVRIDGFDLEAVPDGDFLVIFNRDKPGVIADVGEALGHRGINIAQMYNGRDAMGEKAITLIRVDARLDEETLREIREFPNILSVSQVALPAGEAQPTP